MPSLCAVSALLLGSLALAQPAAAAIGIAALPMAVAASAFAGQQACPASVTPASGMAPSSMIGAVPSKASSLLGGQVSQLDLIREQQASSAGLSVSPVAVMTLPALIEPAAGPRFRFGASPSTCAPGYAASAKPLAAQPALAVKVIAPSPYSPDDFLASKRLEIRHTGFDRDWDRVERKGLSGAAASGLLAISRGHPDLATLAAVNSWANARIRYVEDRELYGKADYWASAGETLKRGAGDCEDIAIAKLQLLAAMGVPREDMVLTIARDLVRAADHAVLVVKLDGRNWLLDNSTPQVLDASQSYDYRPILSYSQNHKWIHGY